MLNERNRISSRGSILAMIKLKGIDGKALQGVDYAV